MNKRVSTFTSNILFQLKSQTSKETNENEQNANKNE